jgi:hypothetical protein
MKKYILIFLIALPFCGCSGPRSEVMPKATITATPKPSMPAPIPEIIPAPMQEVMPAATIPATPKLSMPIPMQEIMAAPKLSMTTPKSSMIAPIPEVMPVPMPEFMPAMPKVMSSQKPIKATPKTNPLTQGKDKKQHILITPFTTYKDDWDGIDSNGHNFSDTYTRVIIRAKFPEQSDIKEVKTDDTVSPPAKTSPKTYEYVTRNAFQRFFSSKDFSVNLSVKISDDTETFRATSPLLTIQHQSNSEVGEQFSRSVYHDVKSFPLFLVKRNGKNGIISFDFSLKGNEAIESHAASTALQVALNVAQTVSPEASVITTLSSQASKAKADAIDNAISKLFNKGIEERHKTDRDLRLWNNDHNGATLSVKIPINESNWSQDSEKLYDVGEWNISFDNPRPSIFVDWYICDPETYKRCKGSRDEAISNIILEAKSNEILKYVLFNGNTNNIGTMESYIAQQSWYANYVSDLSDETKSTDAATKFCRQIRNTVTSLGLSSLDADMVVWAVFDGMEISGNAITAIGNNPDCLKSIKVVRPDVLAAAVVAADPKAAPKALPAVADTK